MLIRSAELFGRGVFDVRIDNGRVVEIDKRLAGRCDELLVEAEDGLLLPGLADHHIHLRSYAASLRSVVCGPPQVHDAEALRRVLRAAARASDDAEWIRGIAYHDSVVGPMDRDWLDANAPTRPLRIQHRSGRLWILNSAALALLGVRDEEAGSDPFERVAGRLTGRLYDADGWLRKHLPADPVPLNKASRLLAAQGITAVTDTTPGNGPEDIATFARAQASGELLQDLCVMGDARLDNEAGTARIARGATKFHLHEHELPEFDALCADIRRSHAAGRACAFHCVTRTDLGFALTALREAGTNGMDRIEHAAVVPPEWVAAMRELRVTVVTQPQFVAERGDAYLRDVALDDQPWLYRLRSLVDAGIPLAFGSDAPFGAANPWAAMQAAVERCTASGRRIGTEEALTPEQALAGWLTPLADPGGRPRTVAVGGVADLCLLHRPWSVQRRDLAAPSVRTTMRGGEIIYGETPVEIRGEIPA